MGLLVTCVYIAALYSMRSGAVGGNRSQLFCFAKGRDPASAVLCVHKTCFRPSIRQAKQSSLLCSSSHNIVASLLIVRSGGIEPPHTAWKAVILPLNYDRYFIYTDSGHSSINNALLKFYTKRKGVFRLRFRLEHPLVLQLLSELLFFASTYPQGRAS